MISFKPLATVYLRVFKMRIEYIFLKILSSLGREIILLGHRKSAVCQVYYRKMHQKWPLKTVGYTCTHLVTLLWSSLETQFSGVMLKIWDQDPSNGLVIQHCPRHGRKVYGWKDLLFTMSNSGSNGEDKLKKKKKNWHKYHTKGTHRDQISQKLKQLAQSGNIAKRECEVKKSESGGKMALTVRDMHPPGVQGQAYLAPHFTPYHIPLLDRE